MPIKIGFSSLVCPDWDFETIVAKAGALGYDGFELRGLAGQDSLPEVAALASAPDDARQRLADAGVELVSISAPVSFESANRQVVERSRRELNRTLELAGKLACPNVRLVLGDKVGLEHRSALARVAEQVRDLAGTAARHGVTILVENGGDFVTSEDLWYVLDAASHPSVRGSWNPLLARLVDERPTISVPRLGRQLAIFHMCDGRFDENGGFSGFELPGQGDAELGKAIDLLKGVCYQGWLICEWPARKVSPVEPDTALPQALEFLRERLAATQKVLTAYKTDKRPPNFKAPPSVEPAPAE